ncbi:MAG: sugar phosphate isomerase/epimerase [Acidobacteriota bacterium]|nr:sugar phosphate isomerase/epimerase [Acidobacteriota bacterium]
MRIGIGSWTYPWSIGVPGYPQPDLPLAASGLIGRARELGVGVVQIADNLPLRLGDLEGLSIEGIEIEVGTRGTEEANLLEYLEIARVLGARLLRTMIDTNLNTAKAQIRKVLPAFERAGVAIAIENYERHATRDLAAFVLGYGSPFLGVCLDTVNSLGALETPEQAVERLAPHVLSLHVKDFDIERVPSKMGFHVVGRPAGSGRLDVPWILSRLTERGRSPNLIVELWTPWAETLDRTIAIERDWARRSVEYLKTLDGPKEMG